jgi:hypothetical protein
VAVLAHSGGIQPQPAVFSRGHGVIQPTSHGGIQPQSRYSILKVSIQAQSWLGYSGGNDGIPEHFMPSIQSTTVVRRCSAQCGDIRGLTMTVFKHYHGGIQTAGRTGVQKHASDGDSNTVVPVFMVVPVFSPSHGEGIQART